MSVPFVQLSLATAQSQSQFVLEPMKVGKFLPDIRELFLQSTLHRRTRLQAICPQSQERSNLAEPEAQALDATDKGQRLHLVFTVSPETSRRPGRRWKQTVALVEANRINAEPNLSCDDANLHALAPH